MCSSWFTCNIWMVRIDRGLSSYCYRKSPRLIAFDICRKRQSSLLCLFWIVEKENQPKRLSRILLSSVS